MNGVKKATEGVKVGKIRPEQVFTALSDLRSIAEPLNVPALQLGETGMQLIILNQVVVRVDKQTIEVREALAAAVGS